jgi:nucleotide-binding universal stress UspA family protein
MFANIVVPLDLLDRHARALQIACELAQGSKGKLRLLHVIQTVPGLSPEEDPGFYATLERKANDRLAAAVRACATHGVTASPLVRFGDRAEQIVQFAMEDAADLIVLMSHPVDPAQPLQGLGTMSHKIGVFAPCAVMLVR